MSVRRDYLRDVARHHGVRAALRVALWRALHPRSARLELVALTDPRPLPSAVEAAREHAFRFATEADLLHYGADARANIVASDLEGLRRGDRCLLQLDGERLVGYAWIAGSPLVHVEDGFHINLPDDTVYNFKSYTASEYRGAGFQALRHLQLLQRLEPEGKRRLFGYVNHLNLDSRRGVRKSGYRRVGVLWIVRKRGKVRARLTVSSDFWCELRRL